MVISRARLEELALYHYVKDYVLPLDWVERIVNEPLTYSSTTVTYDTDSSMEPSPVSEGRGWVYFDDTSAYFNTCNQVPATEQTNRVVVRSATSILPTTAYTVNYRLGRLEDVDTTVSGTPSTVDYYWHYVSVVEGWPGSTPPPLPIVAIDITDFDKSGFQLGGGNKTRRSGKIHIFATSPAERSDLAEMLYNAMFCRHIILPDFATLGEPLNMDGTFNQYYTGDVVAQGLGGLLYTDNVKYTKLSSRPDWSLLNRFRGTLTFDINSYIEEFVQLV
jgi:hypothetical protein